MTVPVCGDGTVDAGEECDDGNTIAGDGCTAACLVDRVAESEPNHDGTPNIGGAPFRGNDFSPNDADGVFTADIIISGALGVPGDEDVFAIRNTSPQPRMLRLDLFDASLGLGVACTQIDTVLILRDADPTRPNLGTNDDRAAGTDLCSGISAYLIAANTTIYVQVKQKNDDATIAGYLLRILFP